MYIYGAVDEAVVAVSDAEVVSVAVVRVDFYVVVRESCECAGVWVAL